MAIIERCGNCAFWVGHECRRKSPIVLEGVVGTEFVPTAGELMIVKEKRGPLTHWPKVESNDFCGEFELRG